MTLEVLSQPAGSLEGLFFHTFLENGGFEWQGYVVKHSSDERITIQLFSWFMGDPTSKIVVNRARLTSAQFYESAKDWRWEYARRNGKSWEEFEQSERLIQFLDGPERPAPAKSQRKTSNTTTVVRESIGPRRRFEVLKRDGFRCRYCGKSSDEVKLEIDHIIPVAKGGTNDVENLIASCRDCNSGKRTLSLVPTIEGD